METLIYLAIYAIIMSGVLVSAYAIFSSGARNQTKAMVQQEGSFLIGKIDWALTGALRVNQPNDGDAATIDIAETLSVTKYDASAGDPIVIAHSGPNLTIARASSAQETLNNSNVEITCAPSGCFTYESASGDGINPESVSASFTVAARASDAIPYAQTFYTKKYLRR
jgi:hypothetical protein